MKTKLTRLTSLLYLTLAAPLLSSAQTTTQIIRDATVQAAQDSDLGTISLIGLRFGLISDLVNDTPARNAGAVHVVDLASGNIARTLRATDADAEDLFGTALALRNQTAVIGASRDDQSALNAGAAYVFNLATGQQQLKMVPQDPAIGDNFGSSLDLLGDVAIVGAPNKGGNRGAAYLMSTTDGSQLLKLTSPTPSTTERFGAKVALRGQWAIVSAPGNNEGRGAVHIFNTSTGSHVSTLRASDSTRNDGFGTSLAVYGDSLLVGAPFHSGLGINSGAAYQFSLRSLRQLKKLTGRNTVANDRFGSSVSVYENLAVIGAPNKLGGGAAYLFDAFTFQEISQVFPPELREGDLFGISVSTYAGNVIIGAPQLPSFVNNGPDEGYALLIKNQISPLPGQILASLSGQVPGLIAGSVFTSFERNLLNDNGKPLIRAQVNQNGIQKTAILNTLSARLEASLVQTEALGANLIAEILDQVTTEDTTAVRVRLSGSGITEENDGRLIFDDGTGLRVLLREGGLIQTNGAAFTIREIRQVHAAVSDNTISVRLLVQNLNRQELEVVALLDLSPNVFPRIKATLVANPNLNLANAFTRSFEPRLTMSGKSVVLSARLGGVPSTRDAALIELRTDNTSRTIATKGNAAPGTVETFEAFLAESASTTGISFLARLSGPEATNEAIYLNVKQVSPASNTLLVRKGATLPALPGVQISAFVRFWTGFFRENLIHVKISGEGVDSTNDDVLITRHNGRLEVLLREGDFVSGGDAARVGDFLKVDFEDGSNTYSLLTTLRPNASSQAAAIVGFDKAIWTGSLRNIALLPPLASRPRPSVTPVEMLRPALRLRTGSLHLIQGRTARVQDLDITVPTGSPQAGNQGQGTALGGGKVATLVQYNDASSHATVVKALP